MKVLMIIPAYNEEKNILNAVEAIRRYKNIKVSYYDERGNKIEKILKDFTARLVQHECDHLDGFTLLDRVEGPHGFATKDMIRKFNLNMM